MWTGYTCTAHTLSAPWGVGGSSGVAGAFKVLWASPHKRIVLNNNSSVAEKWALERQAAD